MTPFVCIGLFSLVFALLAVATATVRTPGFALGRTAVGALVVLVSVVSLNQALNGIANRERAFDRGNWAKAELIESEGGADTPRRITLRVEGPDCEFEHTEHITGDFASSLGCAPGEACPTGREVRVALGEPPCSKAYADPRGSVSALRAVILAASIGALAGLLFVWSGLRQWRTRR